MTSKAKGDRGEREAISYLQRYVPDLLCETPQRRLGLGRHDDTGDLDAFEHVAVQVKSYAATHLASAVRIASEGARKQAQTAKLPFGVGMVVMPRKPVNSINRWLFTALDWPTNPTEDAEVNSLEKAIIVLDATRSMQLLVKLDRGKTAPIFLSWLPRWSQDYQAALKMEGILAR